MATEKGQSPNRLRSLRKQMGQTVWGIATRAGVSPTTVTAIEKYDYMPGEEIRHKIAAGLDLPIEAIWPRAEGQK